MATKEETRARLEALKKDQNTLKHELAALDTFMEKKARRAPRAAKPQAPRQRAPQRYQEPAPRYQEPAPRYEEQPRYREPAPQYSEPPRYREDDMYEMMRRNLDESRKMMDKFDYLLDTLIQSMEEVEGENVDDLIKALAQSQMHVMDVLTGIKTGMDKTSEEVSTKEELDEFERGQVEQYQELNKKINSMMEQMQHPPYLQELDQIRVQVSNLASELHRLQKEGLKVGGVSDEFTQSVTSLKSQTEGLGEKLNNVCSSLENINEHVNQVQATTSQVAGLKIHMDKMRDMLSAKDDAILNDTHLKITQLDSRMAELNETIGQLKNLDERLASLPATELGDLTAELKNIKQSLPATSIQEMQEKLTRIEGTLNNELKKKQNLSEDREILLRLVKKTEEMEEDIDQLEASETSGAAAETFSRMALENKIEALEKLVVGSDQYDELKQMQKEYSRVNDDLKKLRRQVKAIEVIESFTRMKDKSDNITELKLLEERMVAIKSTLESRVEEFENSLTMNHNESEEKMKKMMALLKAMSLNIASARAGSANVKLELQQLKRLLPDQEELTTEFENQKHQILNLQIQFEEKINELENVISENNNQGELESKYQTIADEMDELQRQLQAVEVIGTFSRMQEQSENQKELVELEKGMDSLKTDMQQQITGFVESLNGIKQQTEGNKQQNMRLFDSLKKEMNEVEELELELKQVVPQNEDLKTTLKEQRQKLAEVEAEFDKKTKTLEREMMTTKEFFEKKRKEREELISRQLTTLRKEVIQAREDAKEVPENLNHKINTIYAEMEKMKQETPEELKSLAMKINVVNSTMDDLQKSLRYGEANEEKIEELTKHVDEVYSQITALSEEAARSQRLMTRIDAMEKALEHAKDMQGKELESAIGAIKNELQSLEGEIDEVKKEETDLSQEVSGVHGAITALEQKTTDEIYSRIHDLKTEVASTHDLDEIKKALNSIEKRVEKESSMENIHDRILLAKETAEKGDKEGTRVIIQGMVTPKQPFAQKIKSHELEKVIHELELADQDYLHFVEKVAQLKKKYDEDGTNHELERELKYLEEDLLDFWIEKRGLAEALAQAKKGNMEEAKQLLEYERGILEDLKLDINTLRMKAGTLSKKTVEVADSAIARREHAEDELSSYDALQESIAKMRKERLQLKKELDAVKARTVKTVVPEKIQSSLKLAQNRPTPAIGKEVAQLERDLTEKKIVPITEKNLGKARDKLGELAGKAKQIEFGTGDKRLTAAREKLEKSRERLKVVSTSSESIKQMALIEELSKMKSTERVSVDELSHRTGIGENEIKLILPTIVGNYAISGEFVTKP